MSDQQKVPSGLGAAGRKLWREITAPLAEMELELSDLLGRKVDLREPDEISKYFRDKVLASAVVQYERG